VASQESVTLADIESAAARLQGVVRDLPVHSARWLSDLVGGPAFLATENLQRAGSFKIRGAYNRLSRLTEAERATGVVAASAGNHAQGVALAAGMLGIRATMFMPRSASVVALTNVEVDPLTAEKVEYLIAAHPEEDPWLMRQLAER